MTNTTSSSTFKQRRSLKLSRRHFRGAIRTDENVTIKQLHCTQRCFWEMIWTTSTISSHQLLVLWIIHVVLSLMSRLVHIFLSTMVSFRFGIQLDTVIAIRMLPVFRFSYPKAPSRSIRLQSTNHRFVANFPDSQSTNHRLASRFA